MRTYVFLDGVCPVLKLLSTVTFFVFSPESSAMGPILDLTVDTSLFSMAVAVFFVPGNYLI